MNDKHTLINGPRLRAEKKNHFSLQRPTTAQVGKHRGYTVDDQGNN